LIKKNGTAYIIDIVPFANKYLMEKENAIKSNGKVFKKFKKYK
jgi:hypothetical protein